MVEADAVKPRLLFVCSNNRHRSLTAERLYENHPNVLAKSAGTNFNATTRISSELLLWADAIAVMGRSHEEYIRENFATEVKDKTIFHLDIRDRYMFMEEPLVEEIHEKMVPVLAWLDGDVNLS